MFRLSVSLLLLLAAALSGYAQTGSIRGIVFNSVNREPLPFANVTIDGSEQGTATDIDGKFELSGLKPGIYTLRARYVSFNDKIIFEVPVSASRIAVLDIGMEESSTGLSEVVVRADPFRQSLESPLSVQTMGIAEIERNPGANRDISKVIQSLPGVASTVSFRNDIIIRGGAPNENRFYLDGVEIPVINHFSTQGASGGPVGIINVNFLNEASLYASAFPANRGNALSSVLELTQRDGRDDRLGGTFTLGASDAGITAEGPLGEKANFIASVRNSYLQFLFRALELPFLPNYTDAQFRIRYRPAEGHEITVLGLGAIDRFTLNLEANQTETQQYLLDNLPVTPQWNYTNGVVYRNYRDKGYTTVVLSRNMLNNRAYKYRGNDDSDPGNLILDYHSQESENKFRVEQTSRVGNYRLNGGVNLEYARYTNDTYNLLVTPAGVQEVDYTTGLLLWKWGVFGQASRSFFSERLGLSFGLRADAADYSTHTRNLMKTLSPRASLTYGITERLKFNATAGRYYQLPPYTILGYKDSTGALVNRENGITWIRTDHLAGGLAYNLRSNTRISVEGFYKQYSNYPFLLRDSISMANLGGDFGVIGNEPADARGKGRTYGLEVFIQQKLFKGFYGLMSYTLLWSEFTDKTGAYIPSAWDSRHIVTLTGGKKFGRGWETGLRFRYGGGNPYTPQDELRSGLRANWDVRGQALPNYSLLNTERLKPFHNLDLRIDKKYFFEKWSLNIYIDVQNVYNFQADEAPILTVQRDAEGKPLVDPTDPNRYLTKTLQPLGGTVLPTLGIIMER